MEIMRTAWPERGRSNVKLWLCGGCDVVHMAVGKTVLNFDREQFSEFAEAVADIGSAAWFHRGQEFSIVDLVREESEAVH